MGLKKIDRVRLVETAGFLFRTQGYAYTTMADIARALGVNKASLYYHFPSKKALTLAAIQHEHQIIKQQLFSIVPNPQFTDVEQITAFEQAVQLFFLGRAGFCLMLKLVAETSHEIPEFAELLRAYFTDWINMIMDSKGLPHNEMSRANAQDSMALLYGKLILRAGCDHGVRIK